MLLNKILNLLYNRVYAHEKRPVYIYWYAKMLEFLREASSLSVSSRHPSVSVTTTS